MFTAFLVALAQVSSVSLKYAPTPADNPLKGLVPYQAADESGFPYSMEFNYVPLGALVKGERKYDWAAMEALLNDVASRGRQTVVRIFLEYPGHKNVIPQYLIDGGLKVHKYVNTNTQPLPPDKIETPDYSDQRLRACLKDFIAEFGKKYDGDPRLAYITAGLLGTWGEWHTYPRDELMAKVDVQIEVMDAYETAFRKTPVLLRYPRGAGDNGHAANDQRRLGYHDDSFAWATLPTGKSDDFWYYIPALRKAGPNAMKKWMTQPIGGEIRPEAWGKVFDAKPSDSQIQDFEKCVKETHATWLMDSGMSGKGHSTERIKRAKEQIRKMGYDFYVSSVDITGDRKQMGLKLTIENLGVAPFYAPWKLEVGAWDSASKKLVKNWPTSVDLRGILPGKGFRELTVTDVPAGAKVLVRVVNPLKNGRALRFANATQDQDLKGWLTLF